jgi:hypothetical protein
MIDSCSSSSSNQQTCIYIQVHLVVYLTLSFIYFFIKKGTKLAETN